MHQTAAFAPSPTAPFFVQLVCRTWSTHRTPTWPQFLVCARVNRPREAYQLMNSSLQESCLLRCWRMPTSLQYEESGQFQLCSPKPLSTLLSPPCGASHVKFPWKSKSWNLCVFSWVRQRLNGLSEQADRLDAMPQHTMTHQATIPTTTKER